MWFLTEILRVKASILNVGGLAQGVLIQYTGQLDNFIDEINDLCGNRNHILIQDLQIHSQFLGSKLNEVNRVQMCNVITVSLLPQIILHVNVIVLTKQLQHPKGSTHHLYRHLFLHYGFLTLNCWRKDPIKCFLALIEQIQIIQIRHRYQGLISLLTDFLRPTKFKVGYDEVGELQYQLLKVGQHIVVVIGF